MLEHEIVAELLADLAGYLELRDAVHEIQMHPNVPTGYLNAFAYLQQIGHTELARHTLRVTIMANPGHAAAHTYLGCLQLGERFPHRIARVQKRVHGPHLHFPTLGVNGRFGNQIFQYAFLRLAAKAQGLVPATPDWVGRYLFVADEPAPLEHLPTVEHAAIDVPAALAGISSHDRRSILGQASVLGYFADHTRLYKPYRTDFEALFQPGPWIQPYVDGLVDRLHSLGKTVFAVHIRRGDMVTDPNFWVAPTSWYLEWLKPLWTVAHEPILYVASDDASVIDAFSEFHPITSNDLTHTFVGAEYYPDWCILQHADQLAISNSTFSFTAALLNRRARAFFRPSRRIRQLVPFDPWDAQPVIELV